MKTYGLIGKTLKHSFSQKFFTEKFEKDGTEAQYLNFELAQIEDIIEVFNQGVSGLNVTIPYKELVIPFLDELAPEAQAIGAVNTIVFKDGKTIGHNTDAYGFQQSIKPFLTFEHERALILGTGGASKAVAHVLKNIGLDLIFISRTERGPKTYGYQDINEHMLRACKCIINTTPVGTWPNIEESIPLPYEHLTPSHLCIDLIYNPEKTRFLQQAEANGSAILNGESMLKHQALRAYELWNS